MFFWWLGGVLVAAAAILITFLAGVAGGPVLLTIMAIVMALAVLFAYIRAYVIAWNSIPVSGLVDIDGSPATGVAPTPGTPNLVGGPGERNSRAFMIGLNAVVNAALAFAILFNPVDPGSALFIAIWDFVVVSLAAAPAVSTNRVYQGVLGWTGWISPMSLAASLVGFIGFVINLPFAIASAVASGTGVWWPVRLDWTTGVVETSGGGFISLLTVIPAAAGTAGHFSFILAPFGTDPTTVQSTFTPTAPPAALNPSAHEVGHSLDYVAFGGLRNLIALFDQVILGNRATAYTELTADSHVPHPGRFQVNMWS